MNQKMLRQLPWICILLLNVTAAHGYEVNPDFDQCVNSQCNTIDTIFNHNIDLHADPCNDFFKYTCGKNFSNYMLYGSNGEASSDQSTDTVADLRTLLNGELTTENIEAFEIEKSIFKKCLKDAFSQQEMHHYNKLLAHHGADTLDQDTHAKNTKGHWKTVDVNYARIGFGFAFFDVNVVERADPYNNKNKRILQISPTSDNVLDTHSLLMSKYDNKHDNSGYQIYDSSYSSRSKYKDLNSFISEFNKIIPYEKYDESNKENRFEPVTLGDWSKKYKAYGYDNYSEIDWIYYLKRLFDEIHASYYIDDNTEIIVKDEGYFSRLAELLRLTSNMDTITKYIHLRFVSKTIGFVDRNYQEKYSIIPQVKGLICTPGLLVGTAHIYMKTFFPHDNKEMVEEIFNSVMDVIRRKLDSDDFNPQARSRTKQFLRQLSSANIIYGYHDWLENETLISNFYERFHVSDKYIENQLRVVSALLKRKLRSYKDLNEPLFDLKVFLKSFTQENIEFSSNLKQIVFPARLFSEGNYKFLSAQVPNPINYGAAGTAIASKIYELWLRKIVSIQNVTECIADQVPKKLEISRSNDFLLKSTTYLLGLRTAYEAWPNKNSYPIQFPKFGSLTDFVLFFLSFAESMCRAQVREGELQPRSFINIVVSNLEEFSEAFRCLDPERHPMNRQPKCDPLEY